MQVGTLNITFNRTVRVKEGRTPSALPPSLGAMNLHSVAKYRANCPVHWADDAFFCSLHDIEAMWMSFSPAHPVAVMIGAGGINALTGEKLGTVLEKDNYLVCPPQPWLDGWKNTDGSVCQFVATPHKKGDGLTVGEQLIGAESQTGAIGIAVFEPKDLSRFNNFHTPGTVQTWGGVNWGHNYPGNYGISGGYLGSFSGGAQSYNTWSSGLVEHSINTCAFTQSGTDQLIGCGETSVKGLPQGGQHTNSTNNVLRSTRSMKPVTEMGLGRGGSIIQKIYEDPYGLDTWNAVPSAIFAVYLVDAATAAEITGEHVHSPVAASDYAGAWYKVQDQAMSDVAGTTVFNNLTPAIAALETLKSAAFPGNTTNVKQSKRKGNKKSVKITA